MSIAKLLDWCKSPDTHEAMNLDADRLLALMVDNISQSSFEEVVREYDEAMDLLDVVPPDQAWEAAALHLRAVKIVHDRLRFN